MPSFKVTPDVITKISEQFKISEESVDKLHTFWCELVSSMEKQYLAHVIRAMEQELRKRPGHDFFKIDCVPIPGAVGRKPQAHYQKGQYFAIYFCPKPNEREMRSELAHELGHLFLVAYFDSLRQDITKDTKIEPQSSIMGIFTILEKNEFYQNTARDFLHDSVDEVLKDF